MNIASMEVNDGGTRLITDKGQQKMAKLVIAADGANSKIRELAKFPTREWDYNHNAIVTTAKTELAHQQTALQRFIDTGPLAFLPFFDLFFPFPFFDFPFIRFLSNPVLLLGHVLA